MDRSEEKRRFERFVLPVIIEAPSLSATPIVPEDISAGGFRASVSQEPAPGAEFSCNLYISGEAFENRSARVAWTQRTEIAPPTWEIGIALLDIEGEEENLTRALEEIRDLLEAG